MIAEFQDGRSRPRGLRRNSTVRRHRPAPRSSQGPPQIQLLALPGLDFTHIQPSTSTDPAAGPASAGLDPAHSEDPGRATSARAERREEWRPWETRHRSYQTTYVREPACSHFTPDYV